MAEVADPSFTLEEDLKHPESLYTGMSPEYLRMEIEEYYLPVIRKYCDEF